MYEKLINEIFYLNRSLLGAANNEALDLISNYHSLQIRSFPTSQKVFDWTIPQEWILKKALLKTIDGEVICDATENILRVVNRSCSYEGTLSYEELLPHLHFSSEIDDAIPYRTSYYSNNWGFCLTKHELDNLDKNKDYIVDIEAIFVDSFLKTGELKIEGRSKKEIVFAAYLCHPLQSNDGISGVACLLEIYDKLLKKDNYYTYRFFFIPETIGPIILLANKVIDPENTDFCFVVTCVANGGTMNYKKTYLGNHPIDNIVSCIDGIKCLDFFPNGSDERQFSSPKIRIPTSSIMYKMYGKYKEYHTSLDNLDFFKYNKVVEMSKVYLRVLDEYENRKCYIVSHGGCEPFLSGKGLYRSTGGSRDTEYDTLRNWVIFYSDGTKSPLDISFALNQPLEKIEEMIDVLSQKDVIRISK